MIRARHAAALLLALAGSGMACANAAPPPGAPAEDWAARGAVALAESRALFPGMPERARNVILFVGDGMGISTITAARILEGQRQGGSGEENSLAFERLPFVALSKTYSANQQTPDSAPTMTRDDDRRQDQRRRDQRRRHGGARRARARGGRGGRAVPTLLELAEGAGWRPASSRPPGHARDAGGLLRAHAEARLGGRQRPPRRRDGAGHRAQLVERFAPRHRRRPRGRARRRTRVLPADRHARPRRPGARGVRRDGRDLVARVAGARSADGYVWNHAQLRGDRSRATARTCSACSSPRTCSTRPTARRDPAGEPSLAEMTAKAIDLLARRTARATS